jgi:hypothetical protein
MKLSTTSLCGSLYTMQSVRLAHVLATVFTLYTCVATCGCGDGYASVYGTVLLDGQPVQAGGDTVVSVTFVPQAGGATSSATVDSSGRYSCATGSHDGLKPGAYAVAVQGMKIIPGTASSLPMPKSFTPPKYGDTTTSGLSVEVPSGGIEFDIPLDSKAK